MALSCVTSPAFLGLLRSNFRSLTSGCLLFLFYIKSFRGKPSPPQSTVAITMQGIMGDQSRASESGWSIFLLNC